MNINDGFLTAILLNFQEVFKAGSINLQDPAISLMGLLCGLEIIRSHLFNLEDGNHLNILIKNAVRFGFFLFFVKNYAVLTEAIVDSFIKVGLLVGGNQIDIATAKNPSLVLNIGADLVKGIFSFIDKEAGSIFDMMGTFKGAIAILAFGVACFFILLAFIIIALQIFVTFLEFYILSALILILLPWGIFRYTAFIAEKAYGAIVSIGVKIMVLTAVLSVTIPLVQSWKGQVPAGVDAWAFCVQVVGGSILVALLTWLAPAKASGLISGSPNLSLGGVAGTAMAGVGMGMAAARTIASGGKTMLAGSKTISDKFK